MTSALTKIDRHGELATVTRDLVAKAADHAKRPQSKATARAYRADWAAFAGWCRALCIDSLPAGEPSLCVYLTHLAETHAYASVARAYAAIRVQHEDAGEALGVLPKVRNVMANIGREKGKAQKKKKALEYHQLCEAADKLPGDLRGKRNRAILLFGELFGGRRSEIAALNREDLEFNDQGVIVTLRRGKTDQAGKGRVVAIARRKTHCPVAAVEAWIAEAWIEEGALFRSVVGGRYADAGERGDEALTGETIARVVKAAAASLGLDPREYAGHSMRRGFVTTAAKQGASLDHIMSTTGHKSVEMVRGYIEDADPFARAVKLKET